MKISRLILIVWLNWLSLAAIPGHARIETAPPYNEAFDENGRLRPAYLQSETPVYPVDHERAAYLMNMPMEDKNKILPIPLILPEQDYELVQLAAEQRARALTAFFADVVLRNGAQVKRAKVLTEQQLQGLFKSHNHSYDLNYLRRLWKYRSINDINFLYGPDIVRNEKGQFVVLEDNVGILGGVGDVAENHRAFFDLPQKALRSPFRQAVTSFLSDLSPLLWQKRAQAMVFDSSLKPLARGALPIDNESYRKALDLHSLGLELVSYEQLRSDPLLMWKNNPEEPHYLVNFGDLSLLDLKPLVLNEILEGFAEGSLKLFQGPGVEVLSSKAFLPLTESFIRLYLHEDPIIRTQSTKWVTSADLSLSDYQNWVIKQVDGKQGKEVYILDAMTPEGRAYLKGQIATAVAYNTMLESVPVYRYVMQRKVEPSFLPAEGPQSWMRFNVDMRPHTFVVRGKVVTKPVLWGRANWKIPGYLNNVSQNAVELVITTNSKCERLLMSAPTATSKLSSSKEQKNVILDL